MFSAGYDIGGLPKDEFAHQAEALVAHPFHDAIEALEAFPFPSVAALNGHAIGGGLELALSCDLRLASEDAKLGMPPARLGLVYSHTGLRKFLDAIGAAAHARAVLHARATSTRAAGRALGAGQRGRAGATSSAERGVELRRRDRRATPRSPSAATSA